MKSIRRVWLAKGRVHEANMTTGRYGDGRFKDHPCHVGETPSGHVVHGDTHEEIMDQIAGVFA